MQSNVDTRTTPVSSLLALAALLTPLANAPATQRDQSLQSPKELSEYAFCPVTFSSRPFDAVRASTFPIPDGVKVMSAYELDTADDALADVRTFQRSDGVMFLGDGRAVRIEERGEGLRRLIKSVAVSCEKLIKPSVYYPQNLDSLPTIPGFVAVASDASLFHQRIGIWRSRKGTPKTLVASFDDPPSVTSGRPRFQVLARLPFSVDQIYVEPGLDSPIWAFSTLSQERPGKPARIANFLWFRNVAKSK